MHKRNSLQDRLYKRGNIWWVWGYYPDGGKWRETTRQTERKAALAAAREIELRNSLPPDNSARLEYTLEQALTELAASLVRADRAQDTRTIKARAARHLVRLWGKDKKLAELSLELSNKYMDKRLEERASRHTIAMEFQALVQALRIAADHGKYVGDPKKLVPLPLRKMKDYYTPKATWLKSAAECNALLECIALTPANRRHTDRRLHVAAYLHTGVRKAELLRILPEDVELAERRVFIRGTKTEKSARWVWLSPTAVEIFTIKMRSAKPGKPVFEKWHYVNADQALKRAWKKARVLLLAQGAADSKLPKSLSFNDLRRTFCSLMASAGVPMQHCAKLLGHASLDMVMSVYGHLAPDSLQSAVDALPALDLSAVSVPVHARTSKSTLDTRIVRGAA